MKVLVVLLFAVCSVQCRKIYKPLDKNANVDFINMEGGGAPPKPVIPPANPAANVGQTTKPVLVNAPTPKPVAPVTLTPVKVVTFPATVKVTPPIPSPAQGPSQIKPVPVNPKPVANPASTPGPGSVQQLVNYYDSQGRGSPIRPYSYSQAVKQG